MVGLEKALGAHWSVATELRSFRAFHSEFGSNVGERLEVDYGGAELGLAIRCRF